MKPGGGAGGAGTGAGVAMPYPPDFQYASADDTMYMVPAHMRSYPMQVTFCVDVSMQVLTVGRLVWAGCVFFWEVAFLPV